MISYRFVPISSQKGVLFLRHPVYLSKIMSTFVDNHGSLNICHLDYFVLCPSFSHSSFYANNITLSLPSPCSFSFQLSSGD